MFDSDLNFSFTQFLSVDITSSYDVIFNKPNILSGLPPGRFPTSAIVADPEWPTLSTRSDLACGNKNRFFRKFDG